MPVTSHPGDAPYPYSTLRGATECVPGGNGHGSMRQLGRLYAMLLAGGELDGVRVLRSDTAQAMVTRSRVGMYDHTFKHKMDWGLGIIVNSNRYGPGTVPYGFGKYCSEETFGHSGSQSSTGFADPGHGLIVAATFIGMPGDVAHNRRIRAFLSALYQDLGLA